MSELILGGIIIVLLGVIGWIIRENSRERSKLINAILAKDSQEYVNRSLADVTRDVKPIVANPPSDLIPETQMSDEDFDRHIQEQLESLE